MYPVLVLSGDTTGECGAVCLKTLNLTLKGQNWISCIYPNQPINVCVVPSSL